MPRVLIVAPMPSHPAIQGNTARLRCVAEQLKARGASIELLFFQLEQGDLDAMRRFWDALHVHAAEPVRRASRADCWGLDDWCPASLTEHVRQLHAARRYDVVLVNYVWLSQVLDAVPDAFKIIDTHDMFGGRHHLAVAQGMQPSWFFTTDAEEGRGLDRADRILAIQDEEAAGFARRTRTPVMMLGHASRLEFLFQAPNPRKLASFGWFGSGNPWNRRGVLELDAALAGEAGLSWLVAGTLLSQSGLHFRSAPLQLGVLREPAEFYAHVDCVVNPMPGGTGLKIKTVEALMMGLPVIGTEAAFAGLSPVHPAHRIPDVVGMLPWMRRYLDDAAFRGELALASRVLALRYAARVEAEYDALWEQIAQAAAERGAAANQPGEAA